MDALAKLERQIQQRLDEAAARQRNKQLGLRQDMQQLQQRTERFESVAQRLMADVIRPRMARLASLFKNAHLSDQGHPACRDCSCRFDHIDQFPANTVLTIRISADASVENAIVSYQLEILPIFFQFDGHDQLVVPIDAVDNELIATWLDRKLLQFTDTYLQLQVIEQYQLSNMVVDPVCGMRINRADAATSAVYDGRTYYFCVELCRDKFQDDPERYSTHRK